MIDQMRDALVAAQKVLDEGKLVCNAPEIEEALRSVYKKAQNFVENEGSQKEMVSLCTAALNVVTMAHACRYGECQCTCLAHAIYDAIQAEREQDEETADKHAARAIKKLESFPELECSHPERGTKEVRQ